jgi:hypothetical protein
MKYYHQLIKKDHRASKQMNCGLLILQLNYSPSVSMVSMQALAFVLISSGR